VVLQFKKASSTDRSTNNHILQTHKDITTDLQQESLFDRGRSKHLVVLEGNNAKEVLEQSVEPDQPRFFVIFTTSTNDTITIGGDSKTLKYSERNNVSVSGEFSLRHRRSIESIFYHQPLARVFVFSNTLPHDQFEQFLTRGYSISIVRYDLEDLLSGIDASVDKWRESIEKEGWDQGPFYYSHLTDLMRLVIIWKYGPGTYIDLDVILVKPFAPTRIRNAVGLQRDMFAAVIEQQELDRLNLTRTARNRKKVAVMLSPQLSLPPSKDVMKAFLEAENALNGAVLANFDRGSEFLFKCILLFSNGYKPNRWAANGPNLLTRMKQRKRWKPKVIDLHLGGIGPAEEACHLMPKDAFYPVTSDNQDECWNEDLRKHVKMRKLKETIEKVSYAVHLSGKVTATTEAIEGTVCFDLLNDFCVFCEDICH